jgi:hypothetical protein
VVVEVVQVLTLLVVVEALLEPLVAQLKALVGPRLVFELLSVE